MQGTITVQAAPAPAADPVPAPAADPAPASAAQPQTGGQPANPPRTSDEDASANLLPAALTLLTAGAALRLWLRRRDLTWDCL